MIALNARPSYEQAQKAALDFEAAFLSQNIQSIFEPLAEEGLFGGGKDSTMFVSFLADSLGKTIAQTKGIGLAEKILPSMMKGTDPLNLPDAQFLSPTMLASLLHQQSTGTDKGV